MKPPPHQSGMEKPVSKLIPISPQTHSDFRWRRPSNFLFTGKDHLIPLGLREMNNATLGLPAGFIRLQDKFLLVGIQGFRNGENLVVDENGKWLAVHLPDGYQGYPLRMIRLDQERYQVCVEEESELVKPKEAVPDDAAEWRPFFDDEGKLADPVSHLVNQMQKHAADLGAAERATARLAELELIKEWEITAGDEKSPLQVKGLYTVDQACLAQLDGDSLVSLRDSGALYLIYAQLLSGFHMSGLIRIGQRRWKKPEEVELDFGEIDDTGNISFDNL